MRLTREELIEKFKKYADGRTDDDTISMIEDINDSITESGTDITTDEKIKNAVEEVEEKWRQKYIERFTNGEKLERKEEIEKIENLFK